MIFASLSTESEAARNGEVTAGHGLTGYHPIPIPIPIPIPRARLLYVGVVLRCRSGSFESSLECWVTLYTVTHGSSQIINKHGEVGSTI